jgi:Tol biopolymer transport system component/DNA-binding winged helix-turn-helix (wHTH) protein
VYKGGLKLPLQEQPFRVLLMLLERPGQIVTRQELKTRLWSDDTHVAFDEGLNTAIRKLRAALGDSADNPRFIETIPKRGYRFIAPVSHACEEAVGTAVGLDAQVAPAAGSTNAAPKLVGQGVKPIAFGLEDLTQTSLPLKPAKGRLNQDVIFRELRKHTALAAAALALLVLLLRVAVSFPIYKMQMHQSTGIDTRNLKITPITDTGEVDDVLAFSPDGKLVAYGLMQQPYKIVVKQLATGSEVKLIEATDFLYSDAVFSPDGNFLFYRHRVGGTSRDLYSVPSLGGTSRHVASNVDGAVSFSPDGSQMAFCRHNEQLVLTDATGQGTHVIYATDSEHRFISNPSWSRDLGFISVSFRDASKKNLSSVAVIDPQGKLIKRFSYPLWVREVEWLPRADGMLLIAAEGPKFARTQIWFQPYSGEAFRTSNDLTSYYGLKASADGTSFVSSQIRPEAAIYVGDSPSILEGKINWRLNRISREQATGYQLTWAASGRLVYKGLEGGVTTSNPDGGNPAPIPALDDVSQFTPCGLGTTFAVLRLSTDYKTNIWTVDVDSGEWKQVTHSGRDRDPACTPDGRWIVYHSRDVGGVFWKTLKIPSDGNGNPVELGPAWKPASNLPYAFSPLPAISPDGKSIAELRAQGEGASAKLQFEIVDIETGKSAYTLYPEHRTGFDASVSARLGWTPNGRNVTYVDCGPYGNCQVFVKSLSGGEPKQLTHFDSEPQAIVDYAWSRDGKKFAITRARWRIRDVVMFSNFR